MDKTTKICITAIIISLIWFSAQPIGGRVSFEAELDHVPYLNLTNSTVSGHAEVSGYMPVGIIIPVAIADTISELNNVSVRGFMLLVVVMVGLCIIALLIHLTYRIIVSRRNKNEQGN